MKKIFFGLIVIALFFSGCKKVITETPYSFLTPQNFPTSAVEADAALNGCYTNLRGDFGSEVWDYVGGLWMSVQNDVAYCPVKWGYFVNSRNNSEETFWNDYWKGINSANNLIAALEARDVNKDPWVTPKLAEAKAFRAYLYNFLACLFGDLPLRLKPTTETVLMMPRSPAQAIYDSIILPDLAFADGKLPSPNSSPGRISQGALKCIEADVYMKLAGWRRSSQGDMVPGNPKYWPMARDAAKAVLDMEAAGVYALEPKYSDVFTKLSEDQLTNEVIFDLEFTDLAGSNFPYVFGTYPSGPDQGGGNGNLRPIPEWLRTQDPRDERWKWNIADYHYDGWAKVPFPAGDTADWRISTWQKIYPSTGYWQDHLTNWPFYRLSEAKLMYAEAANEAEGGPSSEAYRQINGIRYRARPVAHKTDGTILPDLAALTQDQFRKAVWNERAMEFINEGKRYLDLRRWGVLKEKIEQMELYKPFLQSVGGFNMRFYLWNMPYSDLISQGWANNAGY